MTLNKKFNHYKLNYHGQKVLQTLARDTRNNLTAVSTLLGFISSIYGDIPQWRSNEQSQNAEPKLYHKSTSSLYTSAIPH